MMAALLKLQPNQDITEGLEAAVADLGITRARIVVAVGSLVEGVLYRNGTMETVTGPAVEVAALTGRIDTKGTSMLHGYLCRQDTNVVEGHLVRGRNAVGVTFELLVEACDDQC